MVLARDQGSETSVLSEDIEVMKCADQEATKTNPAIVALSKLETFKSYLRCQGRVEPALKANVYITTGHMFS